MQEDHDVHYLEKMLITIAPDHDKLLDKVTTLDHVISTNQYKPKII